MATGLKPVRTEPSPGLLLQMIEQNDEKHDAGHKRLRRDLTDCFNDMGREIDELRTEQKKDHDLILGEQGSQERRRSLSTTRAVIIAALIGGGFRLIEVVINAAVTLVKH